MGNKSTDVVTATMLDPDVAAAVAAAVGKPEVVPAEGKDRLRVRVTFYKVEECWICGGTGKDGCPVPEYEWPT
jgi:hypothetical protein